MSVTNPLKANKDRPLRPISQNVLTYLSTIGPNVLTVPEHDSEHAGRENPSKTGPSREHDSEHVCP